MKGSKNLQYYRDKCRKQVGRSFIKLDDGLAERYGNDFAIFIQVMIRKQEYFQWHFPKYKGTFFLTNEDIMEECRFTLGQTRAVKRKARELNIIPKKPRMLSTNFKDTKVTREWFDINWEALWLIFHESAISKSTWQMGKNRNGVTNSLPTDLENPTGKVPCRKRHDIYSEVDKGGPPSQSSPPFRDKSDKSSNNLLKALFQSNKDTICPNGKDGKVFISGYNVLDKRSKCCTCPIKDICEKLHKGNITFDGHLYYRNRAPKTDDDGKPYYYCEDGLYRSKAGNLYSPSE